MRRRALAALALAGVGLAALAAERATATPSTAVAIDGTRYAPEVVTVKRGTRVTWKNQDPFPHTVTARGVFDSRDIAAGKSWTYTAAKAGRYDYICTLHPNMKGTLVVE